MAAYVPSRGDVVWVSLDPRVGHEQRGRRPALVLSPKSYNARVGLVVVCPITSQAKQYPFEVSIPGGLAVSGVVLSDQVKSLDWRAREVRLAGRMPRAVVEETTAKLGALLFQG